MDVLLAAEGLPEALGEPEDPILARYIRAHLRGSYPGPHGSDVDQDTTTLLPEVRQHGPSAVDLAELVSITRR